MSNRFSFSRTIASGVAVAGFAASALAGGGPSVKYNNELGPGQSEINYVVLQFPSSITVPTGANTGLIFGQVYQGGWTESPGPNPSIVAQLGYGPIGSNPLADDSGWTWMSTVYNLQVGNNDEYMTSFTAPAPGDYAYTFRFNLSTFWAGQNLGWTLADLNGAGSNPFLDFDPAQLGVLHVTPTPGAASALGLGALAGLRRRRPYL